jgi:hypothetical protein
VLSWAAAAWLLVPSVNEPAVRWFLWRTTIGPLTVPVPWSHDTRGMSRTSYVDIPTVAHTAYGPVGLSSRTKMLAGSVPWVWAKNGKTADPLEPSPS